MKFFSCAKDISNREEWLWIGKIWFNITHKELKLWQKIISASRYGIDKFKGVPKTTMRDQLIVYGRFRRSCRCKGSVAWPPWTIASMQKLYVISTQTDNQEGIMVPISLPKVMTY